MITLPAITLKLAKPLAVGFASSAAWYALAPLLLPDTVGQVTGTLGAVGLAGLVPALMLKNDATRIIRRTDGTLGQRNDILNKHAIVNVVDRETMIHEVNDNFAAVTGYSREELIGMSVHDLYGDEHFATALLIQDHLRRGVTFRGETQLTHKDGRSIHLHTTTMPLFNAAGDWVGSISARTDITESRRLHAENDTAQVLDNLTDDIWILNRDVDAVIYMNDVARRRFDMTRDEVAGTSLRNLQRHAGVHSILSACRDLKRGDQSHVRFQTAYGDMPFEITISRIQTGTQKGRYQVLMRDQSERLRHEQLKSDFISTVSHELRSPLTSIKGSMGLLLSRATGELPPKAVGLLEIAHRNADRLVLIINDILDLEKIAAGRMEFHRRDVDVNELVEEARQANAALLQRFGVQIDPAEQWGRVVVNTDPNRIIQVLTNFLSNACKFSSPGRTIRIGVDDQGCSVRVWVRDTGQGIAAKDRHKIFERFADLENSERATKGGTGLGLSICKAIVEGLDGTIGFDTTVGVGTTFYFVLPKPDANSAAPEETLALRDAS